MSNKIINAVWSESQSKGRARLVLLAIADMQGEIGAWPSIKTLAKMVNSSERSVQRDIQDLVKMGELRVGYRQAPSQGQYKANLYWVTLPSLSEVTKSDSEVTEIISEVTNRASEVTTVGVLTLIEPLEELTNVEQSATAQRFIEFWNIYPHRKGDARKPAEKSFSRLSVTNQKLAIEGARKLAENPAEPQFRPMAATWLNQERWTSELEPEVAEAQEKDWEWGY